MFTVSETPVSRLMTAQSFAAATPPNLCRYLGEPTQIGFVRGWIELVVFSFLFWKTINNKTRRVFVDILNDHKICFAQGVLPPLTLHTRQSHENAGARSGFLESNQIPDLLESRREFLVVYYIDCGLCIYYIHTDNWHANQFHGKPRTYQIWSPDLDVNMLI